MENIEELIKKLSYYASQMKPSGLGGPGLHLASAQAPLLDRAANALSAQAQEIERRKSMAADTHLRFHDALNECGRLEKRVETAEAHTQEQSNQIAELLAERNGQRVRVQELEERIAELYRAEKNSFLSLKANGETIAAIEAKTIERCAKLMESDDFGWGDAAAAIRALAKTT